RFHGGSQEVVQGANRHPAPRFFRSAWGIIAPTRGHAYRGMCIMGMPSSQQTVQRLVDEHYVALYRYAYRLTGSSADAEDLTQEAFCKAQLNLSQLRQRDR